MTGRFPRKLHQALLFGLNNHKAKLPHIVVKKLESPVPLSNDFTKFLDDCKNNKKEIRTRSCRDENKSTPNNCICGYSSTKPLGLH